MVEFEAEFEVELELEVGRTTKNKSPKLAGTRCTVHPCKQEFLVRLSLLT